jgi:hypothetical protein
MYKLTKENKAIIRISDNAFIPYDGANSDYKEYQKWIAEGNIPAPAEDVQSSEGVLVVSPWQMRKVLNYLNLRDAVENLVQNSNNYYIKDGWEYSTEFREDEPLVQMVAFQLGKSPEDLHNIFKLALDL